MIKTQDKNCNFYGLGHCMVDFFVPNVEDSIFQKLKEKSPLHLDREAFSEIFANLDVKIKKTGGTTVNILKTISRLGGKCFFSGSTGMEKDCRDENALFFQKEMARNGVECQLFSKNDSTSVVILPELNHKPALPVPVVAGLIVRVFPFKSI
mgnify:CR=1 FL=1